MLVLATLATTTFSGAEFYASFASDLKAGPVRMDIWTLLPYGLWFSVPTLLILGAHEMGHYLACRYYGLRASLPYFLPLPPIYIPGVGVISLGFGTLGAVIRIRERILWRRVLFDIGIAGPLAGALVAAPILVFALAASRIVPFTPGPNFYTFGDPLALRLAAHLMFGTPAAGYTLNLHPAGFAAWFGMLITSLNLIPAGQLDGGHIAYACLGRHAVWLTGLSLLSALGAGILLTPSWLFWLGFVCVLLTVTGWRHTPVLDEGAPLGRARWLLALLAIVLLVLCFIPVPIS